MLVDLAAFSEERFDARAWLNAACAAQPPDDAADKYLAELEIKLQLLAGQAAMAPCRCSAPSSCAWRPPDQPVPSSAAGVVLPGASEDIASSLEELSGSALLRIPRAVRDTNRVRDDAHGLRGTVGGILQRLEQVSDGNLTWPSGGQNAPGTEGSSAQSVAALARVDTIKQRMEAAHDTLQDAAGLTKLSAEVEEVFASGDLPRVAETLASMRRCLAVVQEVPEFADMKRQLAVLEDRLEQMVQPRLSEALAQKKADTTQSLRDILMAIGRYDSLEQQYTRARVKPLKRLWEEVDQPAPSSAPEVEDDGRKPPLQFVHFLPHFYDEVLLSIEQEIKWCQVAFPNEHQRLVPKLVVELMAIISASFTAHVDVASQEAVNRELAPTSGEEQAQKHGISGPSSRLGALIGMHTMTNAFSRNTQHLLATSAGAGPAELAAVVRAIYSPFELHKQRYGELERAQLLAEIGALGLRNAAMPRGPGARGAEFAEVVRGMEASLPDVMVALEAAVERCLSLTGGSEAEALLRALDEIMLQYLAQVLEILRSLRLLCGLGKGGAAKNGGNAEEGAAGHKEQMPEEEEWALVQGALQLLGVADMLGGRAAVFEASLKATLGRLSLRLVLPVTSGARPEHAVIAADPHRTAAATVDASVLRLVDMSEKARRLASLLEQSADPRFHALPRTAQRLQALQESVSDLVYDVLMSKIRLHLTDLWKLPTWTAEEEDNAFELPSFSAYRLPYVTAIGEYLLTLPQQLEPLTSTSEGGQGEGEAEDGQGFFATEWMFKVGPVTSCGVPAVIVLTRPRHVAEGATALYIEQLRAIAALSERGARQLAADIEYLCNVLAALSMATPAVLGTFQACLNCPRDQLPELAMQDGGGGDGLLDLPTVRLVCKMRGVPID
eukprot:SM000052S17779  [mRNA]  locus=s52:718780:723671:+ [translate_table: standard]